MTLKRNTIQKSLVLETVKRLKSHATADQIYDEILQSHPNISRGTVYRNLNQLALSGEIKKVEIPNGADCFDHTCKNHYHAKCTVCGKIFDVNMDYMEGLEKSIQNTDGFVFRGHDIIFSGVCSKCQAHHSGLCGSN